MDILLYFTSRLIKELFYDYLNSIRDVRTHLDIKACSNPDIILVDYCRLNSEILNQFSKSKLVLIDIGLKKEQLITFLGVYKLAGIISVDTDKNLFIKALKVINDGQVWLDNDLLKNFIYSLNNSNIKNLNGLTQQEKNIIKNVCEGLSNKQIAVKLLISEQTVKTHLNRIFKKLNINNRAHLVALCKENNLNL